MSEHEISKNLLQLIKMHNLSLSDLAKQTQIPQPTLHHIIDGTTKKPRRPALEALAKFFSISIPQLTGLLPLSAAIPDVVKDSFKISTVPLIEWSLAKNWIRANHDVSKCKEIIIERSLNDPNSFALMLNDSSMEPMFQEKSILIFDPSKKPVERDFILVHFFETDRITFNRLFIDGENYYIKQDKKDGNAELIKINIPPDQIIATLIESRTQFHGT